MEGYVRVPPGLHFLYRALLRERHLTQADLCRITGLPDGTVSRIMSGARPRPAEETRDLLDAALALGLRSDGDPDRPVYTLARFRADGSLVGVVADAERRVGVFGRRQLADATADLLAQTGGMLGAVPVPAWTDWLAGLAVERGGGLMLLDAGGEREIAEKIGRFVTAFAMDAATVPVHEEPSK